MEYYRPGSLSEAQELLARLDGVEYQLLAGGTDLLPRYEQGKTLPENLIDLKKIPDLNGIRIINGHLIIGALTTLEDIRCSSVLKDKLPALVQAAAGFAATQIRNRATVGGNICNASPAGDTLPVLYAAQAELVLAGPAGGRQIPISEFITGPGQTSLEAEEFLTRIIIPIPVGYQRFFKLGLRESMAISVINFAVNGRADQEKGLISLSIAAGAVAPTVVMLKGIVKAIIEDGISVSEAIDEVDLDIAPIDDLRATAEYRRKVLKNVLQYELEQILEMREGD